MEMMILVETCTIDVTKANAEATAAKFLAVAGVVHATTLKRVRATMAGAMAQNPAEAISSTKAMALNEMHQTAVHLDPP